jgi:hypothetical protein
MMGEWSEHFEDVPEEAPGSQDRVVWRDQHRLGEARLIERRTQQLAVQARLQAAKDAMAQQAARRDGRKSSNGGDLEPNTGDTPLGE